ncbi:Virulence transcriptional regulatory protein phoP [Providencia stuartii]|nr:Virulence transcriptional regulatory protein phoP [Providencia stuartii]
MRILIVEDNALLRHHLTVQLKELGHQVDAAEDAKEADYFLRESCPDIAMVDLGLPDEDGLSMIKRSIVVQMIMLLSLFILKSWLHVCKL